MGESLNDQEVIIDAKKTWIQLTEFILPIILSQSFKED